MKHITLIITGSIAAPKALILLTKLQEQFRVNVICTKSAQFFLPATAKDIGKTELFTQKHYVKSDNIAHTNVGNKTDLIVVYPATMSFISKASLTLPDSLALATFLASPAPKVIFPAMNHYMFHNPSLQQHLQHLVKQDNVTIVGPDHGLLACNIIGEGRLPEPEPAAQLIINMLQSPLVNLVGKTILLNFGRTRTYLDPIRYITNESSGKMGKALITAFLAAQARVIAIAGDNDIVIAPHRNLTVINANTNDLMLKQMIKYLPQADVVMTAAAISDFAPREMAKTKITKTANNKLTLSLRPTVDILATLVQQKTNQIIIGFAAQDNADITAGIEKMMSKKCDGICINNWQVMNSDETKITFVYQEKRYNLHGSKNEVALKIITIINDCLTKE